MAQINNQEDNNQEQEIWVQVPDEPYNKTFMISNLGRIKNKPVPWFANNIIICSI